MTDFKPYLSIVVCSRNDNHGEGMMKRQQIFADCVIAQSEKHQIPMELVFVEWNPPSENPSLATAMRWPEKSRFCNVRIVQVPNELHGKLRSSENLPLFQMIAKNVGVRRAEGEFVLCTNVDVIFSDKLCRYIKKGLQKGVLYRNNRYDVDRNIPEFNDLEKTLEYCRNNLVRKNMPNGTYLKMDGQWTHAAQISNKVPFLPVAADVLSNLITCKQRINRFFLEKIEALKTKKYIEQKSILKPLSLFISKCIYNIVKLGYFFIGSLIAVFLLFNPRSRKTILNKLLKARTFKRCFTKFITLNTNACGDFTLLDKQSWFDCLGYWEFEGYSWHLDTFFLFQAESNGIKFKMLPDDCIIYHIDHGGGWSPEEAEKLFKRLNDKGIPYLTNQDIYDKERLMYKNQRAGIKTLFNDEEWGFGQHTLNEIPVVQMVK